MLFYVLLLLCKFMFIVSCTIFGEIIHLIPNTQGTTQEIYAMDDENLCTTFRKWWSYFDNVYNEL